MCVHGAQYGLRNFLKENCGLNLSVKSNFQLHFSIIIEIKDEIASHCYQNKSKNSSYNISNPYLTPCYVYLLDLLLCFKVLLELIHRTSSH